MIAAAESTTHRNSFSVLLRWDLFWSRRLPLWKLYFLVFSSHFSLFLFFCLNCPPNKGSYSVPIVWRLEHGRLYCLSIIAYRRVLLVPSCPARERGTRISCVPRRLLLLRIIGSCCWFFALLWLDPLQSTRRCWVFTWGGIPSSHVLGVPLDPWACAFIFRPSTSPIPLAISWKGSLFLLSPVWWTELAELLRAS